MKWIQWTVKKKMKKKNVSIDLKEVKLSEEWEMNQLRDSQVTKKERWASKGRLWK